LVLGNFQSLKLLLQNCRTEWFSGHFIAASMAAVKGIKNLPSTPQQSMPQVSTQDAEKSMEGLKLLGSLPSCVSLWSAGDDIHDLILNSFTSMCSRDDVIKKEFVLWL